MSEGEYLAKGHGGHSPFPKSLASTVIEERSSGPHSKKAQSNYRGWKGGPSLKTGRSRRGSSRAKALAKEASQKYIEIHQRKGEREQSS